MIFTTARLYKFRRRCGMGRVQSIRYALGIVWRDMTTRGVTKW